MITELDDLTLDAVEDEVKLRAKSKTPQRIDPELRQAELLIEEAQKILAKKDDEERAGQNDTDGAAPAKHQPPAQSAASPDLEKAKEAAIHHHLMGVYLSYVHLKRWARAFELDRGVRAQQFNIPFSETATPADANAASSGNSADGVGPARSTSSYEIRSLADAMAITLEEFDQLSDTLHTRLGEHALLKPFSAELIAGFDLTSMGAQTAASVSRQNAAAVDSQATQPSGFVQWETVHFLSDYQRWWRPDLSVGGTIGFQPTMTLVDVPIPGSDRSVGPLGTFQQAFVWKTAVGGSFRVGDTVEATPFVDYGQTILTNLDTLVGTSGQSVVGTATSNVTGRVEGFRDFGARVSVFGDSLDVLHVDKSSLAPMVWFAFGLRYDARFKGEGALAAFDRPASRKWFTFAVDALQVVQRASASETESSPFSLTVRVDYQTARYSEPGTDFVPSGTSVFLSATTDILKAFRGKK